LLGLVLLACTMPLAGAARACDIIDSETAVEQLARELSTADPEMQLVAYRQRIIAPNEALFEESVLGPFSGKGLDAAIVRSLSDARDPGRARALRELRRALPARIRSFQAAVPEFRCDFPIYLMDSLGRFDGAGRQVGGKPALVLGVDQIARERALLPLELFLAHELFHRHHGRASGFSDDPGEHQAIWRTLWAEGLATYASFRLTPGSSVDQALIAPARLSEEAGQFVPEIAADLLRHSAQADHETYEAYFTFGSEEARSRGLPYRSGYYVGFLIARELGRHRSVSALARLKGPALRHAVETELYRLARGSSGDFRRRSTRAR
jgi:hypothetical protein